MSHYNSQYQQQTHTSSDYCTQRNGCSHLNCMSFNTDVLHSPNCSLYCTDVNHSNAKLTKPKKQRKEKRLPGRPRKPDSELDMTNKKDKKLLRRRNYMRKYSEKTSNIVKIYLYPCCYKNLDKKLYETTGKET